MKNNEMPIGENKSKKYVSAVGNTAYDTKPETLTHLRNNILIEKSSNIIKFRGMLDYAQAKTIELQVLCEKSKLKGLSNDLDSVIEILRHIMSCDVLDKALKDNYKIIGLNLDEIRKMSHNPNKYFGFNHCLPSKNDGLIGAKLNTLRTIIRQTELSAIDAYELPDRITHEDIIKTLNRLSSAVYILFCRYIYGYYSFDKI